MICTDDPDIAPAQSNAERAAGGARVDDDCVGVGGGDPDADAAAAAAAAVAVKKIRAVQHRTDSDPNAFPAASTGLAPTTTTTVDTNDPRNWTALAGGHLKRNDHRHRAANCHDPHESDRSEGDLGVLHRRNPDGRAKTVSYALLRTVHEWNFSFTLDPVYSAAVT